MVKARGRARWWCGAVVALGSLVACRDAAGPGSDPAGDAVGDPADPAPGGLSARTAGAPADAAPIAALLERARAAAAKGDLAGAEAAYAEVLRRAPREPGVSLEFGRFLAGLGDAARAAPLLRHAAAIAPHDPAPPLALAALSVTNGDAATAVEALEAALAAGIDDASTWLTLGRQRASLGDRPAAALDALRTAAARATTAGANTVAAEAYVEVARVSVGAGDAAGAREALREALAHDPANSTARDELARLDG